MEFLLDLGIAIITFKIFCNSVGILYQIIEGALVPQVNTWEYLVTYVSQSKQKADALQIKHMKNNRTLRVAMEVPNSVEIHQSNPDKTSTKPERWYVIELGGHQNQLFLFF